ncbi:MAG: glycogen synthase [bacterium]|nr:glycogen synthase [bacterium]
MKILFASAEVKPFSKVGGLADVVGSLPKYLEKNAEIAVFTPLHGCIDKEKWGLKHVENSKLHMQFGWSSNNFELYMAKMPDTNINVFFIDNPKYFGCFDSVYPFNIDERYNHERFIAFSKTVLEYARLLNFRPDIINANDWHTGMIPVFLKTCYKDDPFFAKTKTVFSIHNLAHQGMFYDDVLEFAAIPKWEVMFSWGVELFGHVNWMRGGINYADKVVTVSPNYAKEIQTPLGGEHIDCTLRDNNHKLIGILNGIDVDEFDPKKDKNLVKNYDKRSYKKGKAECKKFLCEKFALEYNPDKPLIGMVSRLSPQKGFELFWGIDEELKNINADFLILGTGDIWLESHFNELSHTTKNIRAFTQFSPELANQIYAGADMFLMPSKFEPCGLSQMIAMRYGTPPIVRVTGGLEDTVVGYPYKNANGFKFWDYDSENMLNGIKYAVNVFKDKNEWDTLVKSAMSYDYSWKVSAKKYMDMFKELTK